MRYEPLLDMDILRGEEQPECIAVESPEGGGEDMRLREYRFDGSERREVELTRRWIIWFPLLIGSMGSVLLRPIGDNGVCSPVPGSQLSVVIIRGRSGIDDIEDIDDIDEVQWGG